MRHADRVSIKEGDAAVRNALKIVVALLALLAETVGVLGLVGLHLAGAVQDITVLSNPSWLLIVASFITAWVLEVGIAWQVM